MRFNRIPMLVDSFNALEDLPDELDDYFVDYADPAPPRVTYFVHRTVKVGYFPGTRPPRPMFHGLGLHPPLSGASCDYGDGSCPHSPSLHRELTGTDIERWARTYPGVVLNLQGQRRYSPEKGGLETEDAAARRIRGQIVDDFKRMGVRVDLTRGIERSYKWDTPPGLLHLTVSNGYSGSAPHIHFNFEGPRRAVF